MSDLILVWFLVLLLLYNLIKNVDYTGVILLYKSPKCNLQSRKKKKKKNLEKYLLNGIQMNHSLIHSITRCPLPKVLILPQGPGLWGGFLPQQQAFPSRTQNVLLPKSPSSAPNYPFLYLPSFSLRIYVS